MAEARLTTATERSAAERVAGAPAPTVALLPWGDVIEDFLDEIGLSFERFRDEMTGGWLFGYVEALARAGVRSVLVCVSARAASIGRHIHRPTGAPLVVLSAPAPFRVVRRARGGRLARDVAPYLATPPVALARALRREACTAVLCQEYEYPRFDACIAVGRALGVPVFATFQGGSWQASRLERPIRPLTLRAARGLIIASRVEAERVRARYGVPPEKIARIFNPLDLDLWWPDDRAAARAELGIPPEARVAAWHGRVDVHTKGLDLLVDAWERICRERPERDLRLLLVGTGADAPALRALIAERGLRGVHWMDEYVLDRAAMRRWLSAADVYTLPSRREGFPVAPIEAMACGLPVVAADASGVADVLEHGEADGGVVVPREDADALARELGRMLDDPARAAELGRRARARAEGSFSLDAVGRALRDVLTGTRAPVASSGAGR
ncbi:MAG TPA: glycosyltransferase [Gemmatimonadaceae bacterium]|nr:glycosyltransferase [Gemmatimonadaceae bacterium]